MFLRVASSCLSASTVFGVLGFLAMELVRSGVECVGLLECPLVVGRQAALDFLHIFRCWQVLRADAAIQQGIAHGFVVGDVLMGDGLFIDRKSTRLNSSH